MNTRTSGTVIVEVMYQGKQHCSYPSSYKLAHREFVDHTSCQEWCEEDQGCAAVVVSEGLCVKLATEHISPLAGRCVLLL